MTRIKAQLVLFIGHNQKNGGLAEYLDLFATSVNAYQRASSYFASLFFVYDIDD